MDFLAFHASLPFFDDQEGWNADTLSTLKLDADAYHLLNDYITATGLDTARTPITLLPPRLLYMHIRALTADPSAP